MLLSPTVIPDNNPYGVTLYVSPTGSQQIPTAQLLIDLTGGTGLGGAVPGWGNGAGLRWQQQWQAIEPNANHTYNWSTVDATIDECAAAGVYLMWSVAYAPPGYLNIDASTGQQVAAGTGQLASPALWTYFLRQVAARYNGTTRNIITGALQTARFLANVEISNEEYDNYGPLDDQGKWLGDVAAQAIPAFRALHPTCRISLGSVHKKTNNTLLHMTNWMNGLFAHMGGDLADAVSVHNYRGDQADPDPTHGTAGNPSVAQIISTIKAAIVANQSTADLEFSEFGWDVYQNRQGTATVFSQAVQSQYTLAVIDACRKGGVYRTFLFWIATDAKVDTTVTPNTSTAIKSIVQTINGTYTYMQAYGDIVTYQQAHPVWGTASTPTSRNLAGRLNLVTSGTVTPLVLAGLTTAASTLATANIFSTTAAGGVSVTRNTATGSSLNWGEIYAQGTTNPWPVLAARGAPSGNGFFLDSATLDSKQIIGGTWNCAVRLGARDTVAGTDSSITADLVVRVSRYRAGTYTTIGSFTASSLVITATATFQLGNSTFATIVFLPGDRLYADVWANILVGSPSTNCVFRLTESSNATLGIAQEFNIGTPGFQTATFTQVDYDVATRLRLIPSSGIAALDLYGMQAISVESSTAGTFATAAGTTASTVATHIDQSTGFGEIPALGNTSAWPALGALGSPSGHGYFLDSTILDGQTIAAGNWSASLRIGSHDQTTNANSSFTATFSLRIYRYRTGSYTLLGTLTLTNQAIIGLSSFNFPATAFAAITFLTGDRLYVDLWANITVPAPGTNPVVVWISEGTTAGPGGANAMHISIPGAPGTITPTSRDLGTRLNFATPGATIALSLYGTTAPASETTTSGNFATSLGGTQTTVTTNVGTSSGYGELYALGSVAAWPASAGFSAPSGHGYFFDSPLLDGGQIAAGAWSAVVTLGTSSPALVATISLRVYRYRAGTYTLLGTLSTSARTLTGTITAALSGSALPVIVFQTGDRLYADLWLNITTPSTDGAAVMGVVIPTTAGYGNANDVAITTPGAQVLTVQSGGNVASRLRLSVATPVVGSGSYVDLTRYKLQMVMVYASDGVTFLDCWRDAPLLSGFKETINAGIAPLSVTLPRSFDNYDMAGTTTGRASIALGNIVKYYLFGPGLPTTGLLRYQGVIDSFAPSMDQATSEETVTLILTPYSSILSDHAIVGAPIVFGPQPIDVVTMAKWFFYNPDPLTGQPYMNPLTWDQTNPASSGVSTIYTFQNQDMSSVFTTMLQMLTSSENNWFYRVNPDNSFTLNYSPLTAQHTVTVGQQAVGMSYRQDATLLKNVVFFEGATTMITTASGFQASIPLVSSIQQSADVAIYGERVHLVADSRVTDQATADLLASGILCQDDIIEFRATVRLPDYRGDALPALGTDIEAYRVGESIRLVSYLNPPIPTLWDVFQWDVGAWDTTPTGAINATSHIETITYGFDYIDLEISAQQPSLSKQLLHIRQTLQDFTII